MIKEIKSEMPFLWEPKEGSGKSAEDIVFRANKRQRKMIAIRLGLRALNDLKLVCHKNLIIESYQRKKNWFSYCSNITF